MSLTPEQREQARQMGREAAEAAASWAADGNTTEEHARRVLKMLDEGDPASEQHLPREPNLSGEFADDPTPTSLADEVLGSDYAPEDVDELADEWEAGRDERFSAACEEELRKVAPLTIAEVIERNEITMTYAGGAVETDADGWEHRAYTVTLTRGEEALTVPWRQGMGIEREPDAANVLDSLASDAATLDNASSFEDWAAELGYDTDSRKAEGVYNAVRDQREGLERLLGPEALHVLMFDVERL